MLFCIYIGIKRIKLKKLLKIKFTNISKPNLDNSFLVRNPLSHCKFFISRSLYVKKTQSLVAIGHSHI